MYPFPSSFFSCDRACERPSKQKDEFLQSINHVQCGYHFFSFFFFFFCHEEEEEKRKERFIVCKSVNERTVHLFFFLGYCVFGLEKIIKEQKQKTHTHNMRQRKWEGWTNFRSWKRTPHQETNRSYNIHFTFCHVLWFFSLSISCTPSNFT